jgi:hypothetical protein
MAIMRNQALSLPYVNSQTSIYQYSRLRSSIKALVVDVWVDFFLTDINGFENNKLISSNFSVDAYQFASYIRIDAAVKLRMKKYLHLHTIMGVNKSFLLHAPMMLAIIIPSLSPPLLSSSSSSSSSSLSSSSSSLHHHYIIITSSSSSSSSKKKKKKKNPSSLFEPWRTFGYRDVHW